MSKSKKRTDRQTLIAVQKDSAQEGFGQTVNDDVVDAKWQGRWYPAKLISMTSDGQFKVTFIDDGITTITKEIRHSKKRPGTPQQQNSHKKMRSTTNEKQDLSKKKAEHTAPYRNIAEKSPNSLDLVGDSSCSVKPVSDKKTSASTGDTSGLSPHGSLTNVSASDQMLAGDSLFSVKPVSDKKTSASTGDTSGLSPHGSLTNVSASDQMLAGDSPCSVKRVSDKKTSASTGDTSGLSPHGSLTNVSASKNENSYFNLGVQQSDLCQLNLTTVDKILCMDDFLSGNKDLPSFEDMLLSTPQKETSNNNNLANIVKSIHERQELTDPQYNDDDMNPYPEPLLLRNGTSSSKIKYGVSPLLRQNPVNPEDPFIFKDICSDISESNDNKVKYGSPLLTGMQKMSVNRVQVKAKDPFIFKDDNINICSDSSESSDNESSNKSVPRSLLSTEDLSNNNKNSSSKESSHSLKSDDDIQITTYNTGRPRNFMLSRDSLTGNNFSKRAKDIITIQTFEFTYFTKNDEEFVFNPKDINGANQFLKSGINRLSISTKTLTDVKDSRNIKKSEESGVDQKLKCGKEAVFTKMRYREYAAKPDIPRRLQADREILAKLTGVKHAGSLILNRSVHLCPVCPSRFRPKHGGGVLSLLNHLKSHRQCLLSSKLLSNYSLYSNDEKIVPLTIIEADKLKNHKNDRRFCDLSIVFDLMKGDNTALDRLQKLYSATDYYNPIQRS